MSAEYLLPREARALTTRFGGTMFADGCTKSHIGIVLGTEARLGRRKYR